MNGRGRVLCLLPFIPQTDGRHGGARAVAATVLALASRFDVGVLAIRSKGEPDVSEDMQRACEFFEVVERAGIPFLQRVAREAHARRPGGDPTWVTRWQNPALLQRLRERVATWRPDVIQIEYHIMAQFAEGIRGDGIPIVLTHYEAATPAARSRAALLSGTERIAAETDARAWERYEERVYRSVDAIVAVSDRDRDSIASMAPGVHVTCIPLGIPLTQTALDPGGRVSGRMVFVGNFLHPPNVDAALWLISDIFPLVRRSVPDATLEIVGPNAPSHIRSAAGHGVVVTGEVDDVARHLDDAAIVVAPVRTGGGARVKVLDALAGGKAIVTTTRGADGIDIEPGVHAVIADDAPSFARAVIGLLGDPKRRAALGTAARAWAQAHAGLDRVADDYARLYDRLLAR